MQRLMMAAVVLLLTMPAAADETTDREVQHLLAFVEASGCTFVRNGTAHDAADAADHLRLKYSRGGRYVNNADQFIERLASESSCSSPLFLPLFLPLFPPSSATPSPGTASS